MRLHLPTSFNEAVAIKARHPDAVPMAGGTDLLVHWPDNFSAHDKDYIDLSGLADARRIQWTDDYVELGALTTYWDTLGDERIWRELPLLVDAGRQVGAVQIQARGTWAGNIANASPAADGVPVLMAYDAVVLLSSTEGEREVALADFYHGYKQLEARANELIRGIRVPLRDYDFQQFIKVGPRRAQAITKVGVAMARSSHGWCVVANSVAPTVCRCRSVEALIESGGAILAPDDDALVAALAADVAPIDDIRSTAEYRRRVLARVIYFALCGAGPGFSAFQ